MVLATTPSGDARRPRSYEAGMAGDDANALVQRRRLRAELRSARQDAGFTQEEVAAALDWSLSKVIRIEAGSMGISTNDLRELLNYYQIIDPDRIDRLIGLAQAARAPSWWSGYRDVASQGLLQLVGYETVACVARSFEPLLIPGLLQTEEYARAIIRQFLDRLAPRSVDSLVEFRMRRQEILGQADGPLFFFVLDEAVVHRRVGGRAIMLRQIQALAEIAARPNVTLELVPFAAGAHPGLKGPFVVLEFPDPADDDVLYLENHMGDLISRDIPEEVEKYREAFESLRGISFGRDESLSYVQRMAQQMM